MIRSKPDEEEYWNSSHSRAFTFDDDDDEFSRLKESKRAVNSIPLLDEDEDEDEVEKVSWSGEPVGSISWSIKETASSNQSVVRDQAFPKIDTAPSLTKQGSGYSLSSLFKGRSKTGSFQSFSECLSEASSRSFAPELRKPKSEYKDYVSDWTPEETVRRMRRGKVYSLETFRSLKDKLLLLDEAVCALDGNVITAVLIYLKKSLSKEILSRELMSREVALRHYIHYLKEVGEQKLLLDLLKLKSLNSGTVAVIRNGSGINAATDPIQTKPNSAMLVFSLKSVQSLGRTEDMALLQYRDHLSIKDEVRRKDFLKNCIGLPFTPDDATHVQDHYTLLERQIIIEVNDKQMESKGQADVFKKYPRKASILNMPIITTLYYSCFYHYGESEGTYSSPANIRQTFKISEKQYLLTALGARAKLKAWFDVDSLFTTKNWLGQTKKRSPIGFHRVVDILQKNNAPVQVLQEYLCLVEDTELRISLAQKHKCHDIIIDTYKDLKDRQQLIVYRGKVERGSPEDRKIDALLNNTQIRWKN